MAKWQVQQAKAHFSEVLADANTHGPQIITRHGSETAVVLSITEYRNLTATPASSKVDFRDFLLNGPKLEDAFFEDLRDSTDTGRNLDSLFKDPA